MDIATAQKLNDLTSTFYQQVESSFSATRQAPWQGWDRVRAHVLAQLPRDLRVLDLACGNLRFERYLSQDLVSQRTWAIDNCDALVGEALSTPALARTTYQHLDIMQTLLEGTDLSAAIDAPTCDLSVCFGFMHHVALPAHRARVLQALVDHTRPGGLVAISFWQFARSARILAKAQPLDDPGDYLLGWQDRTDVHRYCHSYEDAEIDALIDALGPDVHELARFSHDGKSRNLNHYAILQIT